jgi:hypothetical protein
MLTIIQSSLSLSLSFSHTHTHTHISGDHNSWCGRCSHLVGSSYANALSFYRFGGSQPLHNIQSIIFCNPLEVLTTRFMIFPLKISQKVFLRVPPLSRCDCCTVSPPFNAFHGRVLYSRFTFRTFQVSIFLRPFQVSCSTSSSFCPLHLCPARRVTFLPAAVTSVRGPQFPLRLFLCAVPPSCRWQPISSGQFPWLSALRCS